MRRSLLGLLTLVGVACLLVTTGCQRDSVLRVASINRGVTLKSDVADWAIWTDPTDPEAEPQQVYAIAADSVEVALQYVEIGAGLPTWTPFEAIINTAKITYISADPGTVYESAVIPMTQYVMADQTNKKITKFYMTAVTATWKEMNFGGDVSDPPDYDLIDVVDATIKFSGWDSVANRTVEATGRLQIEFGNFPDGDGFGN